MSSETLIYMILSGIIALLLALFQYGYKSKSSLKRKILYTFLRFVTLFSILVLIVNPKFEQIKLYTEKPNLVIAVDNSSSIKHLNQAESTLRVLESITKNEAVNNKFNVVTYSFSDQISQTDSIAFNKSQTNIDKALSDLSQVYKETISPIVLISDGNQTYGNDYEFKSSEYKQPIYPIILGDTTVYADLKIQQLNVNKYAYLKNRFPVETIVVYNGNASVTSKFTVTVGNTTVYSEAVNLSKSNNSKIIRFTLPANRIGVSKYRASLSLFKNEKNTINNTKNFAVEVISQKTEIAIVSDFSHPDLGVFKKSIESNEQRSVTFLNSKEVLSQINDFQLIIVYQPNNKFKSFFELLNKEKKNSFVIIGPKTDLVFLNAINKNYQYEITNQKENYQGELDLNYAPFIIDDIDFESFPPLNSNYGAVNFSIPFETILKKQKGNVSIDEPLLVTFENNGRREAVLFGENIWKWRSQSFINSKSFNPFDDFIGKLVQYLASNKKRSRLNVEYESFYDGSTDVKIKAQFFDNNYEFDTRTALIIKVIDAISKEEKTMPLILKNNNFEINLSHLKPSKYSFVVKANDQNISSSGHFEILEYHVEQQFLNANVTKLQQLATNSKGGSYYIARSDALVDDLLNDNRFKAIQKSNKNSLPLIDWKYLLAIIALSLASEWFLRKYNGLI
ncbi:MAG: VWA domain-containing protein [Algibacter sp.]